MLRLILMRHGEAENQRASGEDRLRRLLPIGAAAALRCGQDIQTLGFSPDLVLCSNAERAVATLEAVVRGAALGWVPSKILPDLYLANVPLLLRCCSEQDDNLKTLLVIGHNPGWSELATLLSGVTLSLGTAQAALLEHAGNQWLQVMSDSRQWKLKNLVP